MASRRPATFGLLWAVDTAYAILALSAPFTDAYQLFASSTIVEDLTGTVTAATVTELMIQIGDRPKGWIIALTVSLAIGWVAGQTARSIVTATLVNPNTTLLVALRRYGLVGSVLGLAGPIAIVLAAASWYAGARPISVALLLMVPLIATVVDCARVGLTSGSGIRAGVFFAGRNLPELLAIGLAFALLGGIVRAGGLLLVLPVGLPDAPAFSFVLQQLVALLLAAIRVAALAATVFVWRLFQDGETPAVLTEMHSPRHWLSQ